MKTLYLAYVPKVGAIKIGTVRVTDGELKNYHAETNKNILLKKEFAKNKLDGFIEKVNGIEIVATTLQSRNKLIGKLLSEKEKNYRKLRKA